jgi:hypothetical protein
MCRLKDALIIDQQMEPPPEDEGLFEPDGGVECPEMDENSIYEAMINEPEFAPF